MRAWLKSAEAGGVAKIKAKRNAAPATSTDEWRTDMLIPQPAVRRAMVK